MLNTLRTNAPGNQEIADSSNRIRHFVHLPNNCFLRFSVDLQTFPYNIFCIIPNNGDFSCTAIKNMSPNSSVDFS